MATFQWVPDYPAGVMRNHALSKKLRYASIAETKFIQFVKPEPGYGQRMGDTITIPRVRNTAEPASAVLSRASKIPIDPLALSNKAITVSEYGRGIEYSEESQLLATFDPEDMIQKTLKKQMKLTLDTVAAAAFKTAQIVFTPTSVAGGTFATNGTAGAQATVNMTVAHIKILRDYLTDTIHCEPYVGDNYIALSSTKSLRGIKDDSEFLVWRQYIQPEMAFFRAEVGMIEGIRFVEVNHTNALANNLGVNATTLGEMVVFGDDPVVVAEVKSPELRAAIPSDFGRQRAIAWYGLLAFGIVWDTANDGEARIIHVSST